MTMSILRLALMTLIPSVAAAPLSGQQLEVALTAKTTSRAIMAANGMTSDDGSVHLIYATVASVMGGAVWGDHCSP